MLPTHYYSLMSSNSRLLSGYNLMVHHVVLCKPALETPGHACATLRFVLSCLSSATSLQGLSVTRGGNSGCYGTLTSQFALCAIRFESYLKISFFCQLRTNHGRSPRDAGDATIALENLEIEIRASDRLECTSVKLSVQYTKSSYRSTDIIKRVNLILRLA